MIEIAKQMLILSILVISCISVTISTPNTTHNTSTEEPIPTTTTTTEPAPPFEGKIWALLVAGSNGFYNYRHQADVCHAYQILHANGIPDENIIVMMFDDVAYSEDNPQPGVLINKPGGTDVYKGVQKDYTGETVKAANFLNILKGDKEAMEGIGSGRVIESGPNDHVFVNFVDHGGPGALMFPSDELLADELIKTLKDLAAKKKFNKLVLYVEACYSGSMFDGFLSDNLNIFVTTAADPRESSYACYYDEDIGTYLGDVFSVNWMEDSEKELLTKESLNHQFEVVRTKTKESHVEEYGNLDIGSTKLSVIIGQHTTRKSLDNQSEITDAVPSFDVPIMMLKKQLEKTKGKYDRQEIKLKLHHILKKRKAVDTLFDNIVKNIADSNQTREEEINDRNFKYSLNHDTFDCYRTLFRIFSEKCLQVAKNSYVTTQFYRFVNFCGLQWTRVPTMLDAIDKECSAKKFSSFGITNVI